MKKENVGIYLGEGFVSIARTEGKKLSSYAKFNLSSLGDKAQGGILDEGTLWEALINKGLKEIKGEESDIFVSVTDRDFIFRCFEMPLMSKKEIESSLGFEVEKYIPFKIDELIWDYSYVKVPRHKKINLSFLGIKHSIYKKYKDFFTHLNIKVLNIEPSVISLARVIKSLSSIKKTSNFVLLDFSEIESYITFFYNDLPIFNRYLSIPQRDGNLAVEKMNEEIRISIQYFKREFKDYNLDKLFILCDFRFVNMFSTLKNEVDLDTSIIIPNQILEKEDVGVEHLKAYAAATIPFFFYKFRPVLKESQQALAVKEKIPLYISLNFKLIGAALGVGIIACVFFSIILGNELSYKNYELKKEEEKLELSDSLKNKTVKDMETYYHDRESELKKLKDRFDSIMITYPLWYKLPFVLSDGLWLEKMYYKKDTSGKITLNISGYVFLADAESERESLDWFISNLKEDEDFRKNFYRIELLSVERKKLDDFDTSYFAILLE